MERQIAKLQKKTERTFKIFHKMIAKLLKFNAKLEKMLEKAAVDLQEKEQEYLEAEKKITNHIDSIYDLLEKNSRQVKHLEKLTGRAEE